MPTRLRAKTSGANVKALESRERALELRLRGLTFDRIGADMKISRQAAHQLVVRAMKDAREQVDQAADDLRAVEVSRLDALLAGLWPKALKGDPGSIDRVLKIAERRAKLLGLDAPQRVAHGGDPDAPPMALVGMSADEFRALAADLARKV